MMRKPRPLAQSQGEADDTAAWPADSQLLDANAGCGIEQEAFRYPEQGNTQ